MKTEKTITLSQYMPTANACWDSPDMMGYTAGRMCAEALIEELLEYGYSRTAIIEGLKEAVSDAEAKGNSASL